MKLTASKIKQMANSVIRGEKHYGEHLMMSPARDWYIGLVVFLSIAVAGAYWAAFVFLEYQKTITYEATSPVEIEVYKNATVDAALSELEARRQEFVHIEGRLTGGAPVVSTLATSSEASNDEPATGEGALPSSAVDPEAPVAPAETEASLVDENTNGGDENQETEGGAVPSL